ncbi:UDP-N-acetylmuramoyl-tripeptide--D-alanyl-D-alanine ligase-like [Dioscorea cayenensis subsp. rotundata]|uniref:UDP-MurNAc-pentapeptide synthetase n=1 Tax=Dioscorea cayennensis subsp. rotundata TaxID=55577 RepID=A0AB40CS87_DIOCR|nr:UDP-N-acetylmuramoyl-tripeptide--D-alanyl-D-alanine ligase-like [Dioscorea cayenensis subsp. rotundata]
MEILSRPLGFRVLENWNFAGKNAQISSLRSFSRPFGLTLPVLLKCSQDVCVNVSKNSTVVSCARDFTVVENSESGGVSGVDTESVPQSLPPESLISPLDTHSWSVFEIADAVGGEIISHGSSGTICIDTRKLVPGQWFFARSGENFDGHGFIDLALAEKGCVGVIGNRVCEGWERGFVKVEGDTSVALDKMMRFSRDRFNGVVVGLTGSVGKTTTRTMIALALESLGRVHQTHGNYNYMVGVAMTLIGIPLDAKVAVVELGMGGKNGEILEMARMCQPSVRVILNVHPCHMNCFDSLEEVARAKGELLTEAQPGDVCVLNGDDPLVMSIPVPYGVKKVLFGQRMGCDVRLVLAESVDRGCAVRVILESEIYEDSQPWSTSSVKSQMVEFKMQGPGLHLATNACAAAAVAMSLGVPLPQIAQSLSRFRPVSMRSQMEVTTNGIRIINDAYNANLYSMIAAINALKSIDCEGKRVAMLGDMLELGSKEEESHEMVLNFCCDKCLDLLVLVGERFHGAAGKLKLAGKIDFICAVDSESVVSTVSEMLDPGDVVLVKGSRAMLMEKIVDEIKLLEGRN